MLRAGGVQGVKVFGLGHLSGSKDSCGLTGPSSRTRKRQGQINGEIKFKSVHMGNPHKHEDSKDSQAK